MNPHMKELFDLTGQVAIITGGAGWLGNAMTEALAEAGATVTIIDYNAEGVERTVTQFQNSGLKVIGVVANVVKEKSLRDSIDKVAADCGQLNILVNCAVAHSGDVLEKITCEHFEKMYRNSTAYAIAAQQATTHMRKTGGGSIINIGSMYGMVTSYPDVYEGLTDPCAITYAADKAAVIHMTRYMSIFWAKDNIRVNCISPGPFPNPHNKAYKDNPKMPEFISRLQQKVPLGRVAQPWELKGGIVFLASKASSFVTGQNIVVDGGWTVW